MFLSSTPGSVRSATAQRDGAVVGSGRFVHLVEVDFAATDSDYASGKRAIAADDVCRGAVDAEALGHTHFQVAQFAREHEPVSRVII
jgi:hypothetical protein